jgi:hypothetical protein
MTRLRFDASSTESNDVQLGALVTVANERDAVRDTKAADALGIPVIVDSGAWSNFTGAANVTVDRHIAYLRANWSEKARHIGLDVIGDAEATFRNWCEERDAGLAVEPTIHYGTDPTFIDRYLKRGLGTQWVNLGGMAHLQSDRKLHRTLAAWSAAVIRRCPPGTRFHALGAVTPGFNNLLAIHGVDSTYWLQIFKYNAVPIFEVGPARWTVVPRGARMRDWKQGKYQRLGKLGPTLSRLYGVSASEVLDMSEEQLVELSVSAHCRFGDHYEQLHGHRMTVYLAGSRVSAYYPMIERMNRGNL